MELISIQDAAAKGIERLRDPVWANPLDHLKIDVRNGQAGPWVHLYSPFNQECNGRDPVDICGPVQGISYQDRKFLPYQGPLADSDEYRAEVAKFAGTLGPNAEVAGHHKRTDG